MPNPPRRPFFQIHLSTAIMLMFTAGALIWANATPRTVVWVDSLGSLNVIRRNMFGWPTECVTQYEELGVQAHYDKDFKVTFPALPNTCMTSSLDIAKAQLLCDATVAVLLLAVVWIVCEWLIRRRVSRKES